MKSKVLKLAKRLGKFCAEDILPIISIPEDELQKVLLELKAEGSIKQRSDGTYFYQEETKKENKKLPLFFEFRTKEELDLIIKCFCADTTCVQTALITNLSDNIICKFNIFFRQKIYDKQFNILEKFYAINPQTPRIRNFFNTPVYFYYYNEQTFVSEKKLKSIKKEKCLPKVEDKKFRKIYLKLTRRITHNKMKNYLPFYIAEAISRMNNDLDVLSLL